MILKSINLVGMIAASWLLYDVMEALEYHPFGNFIITLLIIWPWAANCFRQ